MAAWGSPQRREPSSALGVLLLLGLAVLPLLTVLWKLWSVYAHHWHGIVNGL